MHETVKSDKIKEKGLNSLGRGNFDLISILDRYYQKISYSGIKKDAPLNLKKKGHPMTNPTPQRLNTKEPETFQVNEKTFTGGNASLYHPDYQRPRKKRIH